MLTAKTYSTPGRTTTCICKYQGFKRKICTCTQCECKRKERYEELSRDLSLMVTWLNGCYHWLRKLPSICSEDSWLMFSSNVILITTRWIVWMLLKSLCLKRWGSTGNTVSMWLQKFSYSTGKGRPVQSEVPKWVICEGIKNKLIFTNIRRIFMNFRDRCHPDMLHSDHRQIMDTQSKRK